VTAYAKVGGKLAKWPVDTLHIEQGRELVRDEVGLKHRGAVLALVN